MSWSFHQTMTRYDKHIQSLWILNYYISTINQLFLCLSSAAWLEGFLGKKRNQRNWNNAWRPACETKIYQDHVISCEYVRLLCSRSHKVFKVPEETWPIAMVSMVTMVTMVLHGFTWFYLWLLPLVYLQGSFVASHPVKLSIDLLSHLFWISSESTHLILFISSVLISGRNGEMAVAVGFTSCAFASTHWLNVVGRGWTMWKQNKPEQSQTSCTNINKTRQMTGANHDMWHRTSPRAYDM